MSGINETKFNRLLKNLNSSHHSIRSVSSWLILHKDCASAYVKIWAKAVFMGSESKQLILMYLANDVLQNGRKRSPEYKQEFGKELARLFQHISSNSCTRNTTQSLIRLLNIWKERGVYRKSIIYEFKNAFETEKELIEEPCSKKEKHSHVTLSSKAPEPEELIKALNDLENAPSSDAVIRKRISKFPLEFSDDKILDQLKDKGEAENLLRKINVVLPFLSNYNTRLVHEMEHRNKVATMLKNFIKSQRNLADQAEQKLEQCDGQLQNIHKLCQIGNYHLQKQPEFEQLSSGEGGSAHFP